MGFTESIDIQSFIRLYVNHRPAYGITTEDIQEAFQILGEGKQTWQQLRKMLLTEVPTANYLTPKRQSEREMAEREREVERERERER